MPGINLVASPVLNLFQNIDIINQKADATCTSTLNGVGHEPCIIIVYI